MGVVPEQYASTPACSTVLSYQPSRPTQNTAACAAVVCLQSTAGTFQSALTSVRGVFGATTYPDHVADDCAGPAYPESLVKVLADTAGLACVSAAVPTEIDASESPVPTTAAIAIAAERLVAMESASSGRLFADLNARAARVTDVRLPPKHHRR